MIENICHIGPAFYVQGGISSVLTNYKKAFDLPEENFFASYNGSFIRSLPLLLKVCLQLLLCPNKKFIGYQIHTSSYGSFFRKYLISLCLRLRGKKYIAHVHGSAFQKFCLTSSVPVRFFIRNYFKNSATIICITPDMQIFMEKYLNKPDLIFSVVPNPCPSIAAFPESLAEHKLPVKIVFSGRYGKRKGVYDLIRAFDSASFSVPVQLFLFGDGEENLVKDAVAKASKASSIFFSSWLKNEDYLNRLPSFDVLVLPSYAETFGMSLVEAMGYGIPVVSSFSGGIPYVVDNGTSGILVNAGDLKALQGALESLINSENLRLQMGKNAWKRVHDCFSSTNVLNLLEKSYSSLIK
jgi:glycosyltransferase involved in cell wall biosynthesis